MLNKCLLISLSLHLLLLLLLFCRNSEDQALLLITISQSSVSSALEMSSYWDFTFLSFCQEALTWGHDKALDICKVEYFQANELRLSGHGARPGLARPHDSVTHGENHDMATCDQILAKECNEHRVKS